MDNNDVMELLDDLFNMISEAWNVPLGGDKCIIEREKALKVISDIKAAMPSSVAEAKRLVAARDEFIGNAKREAEAMRKSAEDRARQLVDEQEITRAARARAAEMISTAESKSMELRKLASDYVDDLMRQTENSLTASLDAIKSTRSSFRGSKGPRIDDQHNRTGTVALNTNTITQPRKQEPCFECEQSIGIPFKIFPDDVIMICSKRLVKTLSEETIQSIVKKNVGKSLSRTIELLIKAVSKTGVDDNCTVILVRNDTNKCAFEDNPMEEKDDSIIIGHNELKKLILLCVVLTIGIIINLLLLFNLQ